MANAQPPKSPPDTKAQQADLMPAKNHWGEDIPGRGENARGSSEGENTALSHASVSSDRKQPHYPDANDPANQGTAKFMRGVRRIGSPGLDAKGTRNRASASAPNVYSKDGSATDPADASRGSGRGAP